jgi:hypothetical protein
MNDNAKKLVGRGLSMPMHVIRGRMQPVLVAISVASMICSCDPPRTILF